VKLPAGRGKREISIRDVRSAEMLLSIPFERVHGVAGYRAYCSYEDKFVEAMLGTGNVHGFSYGPSEFTWRLERLLSRGQAGEDQERDPSRRLDFEKDDGKHKALSLSIGPATDTFAALENLRSERILILRLRPSQLHRPLTIRLDGVDLTSNDQAVRLIENTINAALFQIDQLAGIPAYPAIDEDIATRPGRTRTPRSGLTLVFPRYQYEPMPMSLYWYARIAAGMPLLQYLAYYQIIEFYFPIFAEKAAHETLRRMLKDPAFDANRDLDVGRLLGSLKPFFVKGGIREEQSALLDTIKGCVTEQELREFLGEDGGRAEYFKSRSQSIVRDKISLDRDTADLLTEVAHRIYAIRCRIVHTKAFDSGGKTELILPFSKEAQQLGYDIELIEFIARQVLIASSMPLEI
jgi:hypothetical protein